MAPQQKFKLVEPMFYQNVDLLTCVLRRQRMHAYVMHNTFYSITCHTAAPPPPHLKMVVLTKPGLTDVAIMPRCCSRRCISAVNSTLHSFDCAYCENLQEHWLAAAAAGELKVVEKLLTSSTGTNEVAANR
jgi:hypothetical protein